VVSTGVVVVSSVVVIVSTGVVVVTSVVVVVSTGVVVVTLSLLQRIQLLHQ
jgi:hypothetical protein